MKPARQRTGSDSPRTESAESQPKQAVNARELAYFALGEFETTGTYLASSFDRFGASQLSASDRGLAMELCYGVVRRRMTLDAVLRLVVDRPRESVENELWTIFRLGAFQLLLMPGLPVHAGVHATVELARSIGQSRWTGIVNGVLRSIARLRTEDELLAPASCAIPLVDVSHSPDATQHANMVIRYLKLQRDAFPDPATDAIAYVSEALSVPRWLVNRWPAAGDGAEYLRLASWFATAGVLSLRTNLLHCDRDQLMKSLQKAGLSVSPGIWPESVRLAETTRIDALPGFAEGWFSVQDESAMSVIDLLNPQPGESVLDLCSAPGGKTTHAAERMRDRGRIVACDIGAGRLKSVRESAERLGLSRIETVALAKDGSGVPDEVFDAALVDAPCSNTGVLGKRPEVRWRLTPEDFEELRELQLRLLRTAAERVRPGGRLVYSTCSIDPSENEGVVRSFLDGSPGISLVSERVAVAGRPGDGGYAVLLRRA
jgi:16S rRNA (cytosine967-C5)-methyltransferase